MLYPDGYGPRRRRKPSMLIGLAVAVIAVMGYFGSAQKNVVTGEKQHLSLTSEQEIALGLQAVPQMAAMHGGTVESGREAELVRMVGEHIVRSSVAKQAPAEFEFHLLADTQTINAFALPGGQVFITRALLRRLETEGQLAGVLGHEIGHVIERHGAEHMAKQNLTQGLTAAAVLATDSENSGAVAQMIGSMLNMRYGRQDELESDSWGVRLTVSSGYDPRSMVRVMEILDEASGGGRPPEFMSTHPDPGNRIERINEEIERQFPDGLPSGLRR